MKILFDRYGAQVAEQIKSKNRLTGLIKVMEDAKYDWEIAPGALDSKTLQGKDVLVLTTRMTTPYSTAELTAITDFVIGGGGLWVMANHAGFSQAMINDNFTRYVSAVSSTFWTAYEPAAYDQKPGLPTRVNLNGTNLAGHPTLNGKKGWPVASSSSSVRVSEVVTRSFCGVYPNAFSDPICRLNNLPTVQNSQSELNITTGVVWALSLSQPRLTGEGRVVICGDSGWLGDVNSNVPGPGEFQNGDNPQYALNTLTWLGGN